MSSQRKTKAKKKSQKKAREQKQSERQKQKPIKNGKNVESKWSAAARAARDHAREVQRQREETEMANLPKYIKDEMADANDSGGGTYIQHGDYIMCFTKTHFFEVSRPGFESANIIHNLVPIESHKKTVYENGKPLAQEPSPVGEETSYAIDFKGKAKVVAGKNSRAVAIGLFDLPKNDKSAQVEEAVDRMCGPDQPAAFMLVKLSTFAKEVRSRPGEYITGLDWQNLSVPGPSGLNSRPLVAARAAAFKTGGGVELVRVTLAQLAEFRAAGGVTAFAAPVTDDDGVSTAPAPTPAPTVAPSAPAAAAPALPPPAPPAAPPPAIPVIDPFAGWTVHPADPNFYYRGTELKAKAELLAAVGK